MSSLALPTNMKATHHHQKENGSILNRLSCMLSRKKPEEKKPSLLRTPRRLSALSTDTKCREIERLFRYLDEDGDSKISPAELRSCMRRVGEELSTEEDDAVVECLDPDGDGLLGYEDFVRLVGSEGGEEEKERSLREAFRVYEMEGEGCITPKSLHRALSRLGEPRTMEECTTMTRRFDLNGDGVISFDEFRIMML